MDRLNAFIDRSAPVLLGRLKRLVGFPTVNPPGEDYEAITGYLTRELGKVGLSGSRFPIPGPLLRSSLPAEQHGFPRFNVLGKLKVPGAKKTIHFNAHYDVVPVSGAWRHGNPFSGAVEKGVIYGRGTADMKGSMASLLTALDALQATRSRPLMNIEVSFTADEETDSFLGARWVVDEAPIRPDYAIVMEGAEGNQVCCGHNGTLWLEVTVHGRAAHGSKPEDGVNSLEKMAALVLELEAYKKQIARRTFVTPEGTTMRPTINVGGVFSCGPGSKINTVPAQASFSIDRRVLSVEDHAEAERRRRKADTGLPHHGLQGLGELLLLHQAGAPVLQGHGRQREACPRKAHRVQRVDRIQRHPLFRPPPGHPHARLRPGRRGHPRGE